MNIIPIKINSKTPAINWKPYQSKQYPIEELEKHNGNRAIICGKTSGNLVIFDLDYKDNNKRHFAKIFAKYIDTYPHLAKTYITETPHGHHFYYYVKGKCPTRSPRQDTDKKSIIKQLIAKRNPTLTKVTNFPQLLKGVDILGQNGYALIPPSKVDGGVYKQMNTHPIKTITYNVFEKIKYFFLKKEPYKKRMRNPFFELLIGKYDIEEQAQMTGLIEWTYWKYLYLEVYHRLELTPEEVRPIIKENQPCFDLTTTLTQLQYINLEDPPLTNEKIKEYFPSELEVEERRKKVEDEPLYVTIGNYLLSKYNLVTMDDSEEILIRRGNVFFHNLTDFINDLADEIVAYKKSIFFEKSVVRWIKMKTRFSRDKFCYDSWLINFKNGYYDIKAQEFYSNDEFKDKLFCYEIPYDYKKNEEADCPKFKALLRQWLGNNNKVKLDDIFEMIGYTMTMNTDMKLAFFIFGPSHAGKTQFQTVLEHVIGHENRGNTSLQRMALNQFGTDGLAFKTLNMVGDMSSLAVKDVSAFKTMTGGDEFIRAEAKNNPAYQFRNITKIWYNGNYIPTLERDDQAFYNRWVLIQFPNVFPMYDDSTVKNIGKTIGSDEAEIRGIIVESLKGVRRLYERRWFRRAIIRNTKHIWKYNAEPLYAFLSDKTAEDDLGGIECYEFRTALNKYFIHQGLRPLSAYALNQQMERYNIFKMRESGGDRETKYMGIKWKRKLDDFING